jgi:1-acyl-sn-glycerol-3-phosphate acyltransferase
MSTTTASEPTTATPTIRRIYRRIVLLVVDIVTLIYFKRYEATGREHVPATGGMIVVCNHLNNADPPMIQRALPRNVVFMAKQEMIDAPIIGLLFKAWGTFPVRRGEADLGALRTACQLVQNGELLMMFPEGTRSRTGTLGEGHPGTAMIARRTGVPILPVAITGTEHIAWPGVFLKPRSIRRCRVSIGEPFTLVPAARVNSATLRADTEEIMQHIAALLPEQYRAVPQPAVAAHAETG